MTSRRTFHLRHILVLALLVFLACSSFSMWWLWRQGIQEDEYPQLTRGNIEIDDKGFQYIRGTDFTDVAKWQGFVTASLRLWQMELMRRQGAARLSEVFGKKALEKDLEFAYLDLPYFAEKVYADLTDDEKKDCNAYATGVNEFIKDFPWRWGIEFSLLGFRPELWKCEDSLLILFLMSYQLTQYVDRELAEEEWRKKLPAAWKHLIFSTSHPWNKPLLSHLNDPRAPAQDALPTIPLPPLSLTERALPKTPGLPLPAATPGSNSWFWGDAETALLANDPHLRNAVPPLWLGQRLYLQDFGPIVGVHLPGIPGVLLGKNDFLAWGFTNTGEDDDDLLIEEISSDGNSYVASDVQGKKEWQPFSRSARTLIVRDDDDQTIELLKTHRGPVRIQRDPATGEQRYLSHQWLTLQKNAVGLPVRAINMARDFREMNIALDRFGAPAQNVLFATNQGDVGLRITGHLIERPRPVEMPVTATEGEWRSVTPQSENGRRLWSGRTSDGVKLAVANQRLWVDQLPQRWSSDDRASRINQRLQQLSKASAQDMADIQLDTHSEFRRLLLLWIAKGVDPQQTSADPLLVNWRQWDGDMKTSIAAFNDSVLAESCLQQVILSHLKEVFGISAPVDPLLRFDNRRSWMTQMISYESLIKMFGATHGELAGFIFQTVQEKRGTFSYMEKNRWQAQHPFKIVLPVLGRMFAVKELPQFGAFDVPRVETPAHGASVRLVWDLKHPEKSLWSFPTGQSGHVRSRFYRHLQSAWAQGEFYPVLASPGAIR